MPPSDRKDASNSMKDTKPDSERRILEARGAGGRRKAVVDLGPVQDLMNLPPNTIPKQVLVGQPTGVPTAVKRTRSDASFESRASYASTSGSNSPSSADKTADNFESVAVLRTDINTSAFKRRLALATQITDEPLQLSKQPGRETPERNTSRSRELSQTGVRGAPTGGNLDSTGSRQDLSQNVPNTLNTAKTTASGTKVHVMPIRPRKDRTPPRQ